MWENFLKLLIKIKAKSSNKWVEKNQFDLLKAIGKFEIFYFIYRRKTKSWIKYIYLNFAAYSISMAQRSLTKFPYLSRKSIPFNVCADILLNWS